MPDVPEQAGERGEGSGDREAHELDVLTRGLREAFTPPQWDPVQLDAMDRAVLAVTAERAAAIRRRRIAFRVGGWGALAAAAGLALAAVVWGPGRGPSGVLRQQGAGPAAVAAMAKDINGDGVVDILDALALHRLLEQGGVHGGRWDFTGDGNIDQRDVDLVAAAAVSLSSSDDGGRG
jgi:hypothetical protein